MALPAGQSIAYMSVGFWLSVRDIGDSLSVKGKHAKPQEHIGQRQGAGGEYLPKKSQRQQKPRAKADGS